MRGQRHGPTALPTGKRPGTHCTGGWVGPRAGLDGCGKSRRTGIRSPDRPVRSVSLYRLSYPGPLGITQLTNNIHRTIIPFFTYDRRDFPFIQTSSGINSLSHGDFFSCGASTRFRVMDSLYCASWSHSPDTSQSVGLVWTSDQPDAETSTWQHTNTYQRHRNPCPRRDSNPQTQQASGRRITLQTARPVGPADHGDDNATVQ